MAKVHPPYACLQLEYTWSKTSSPWWAIAMRSRRGKALIYRDRASWGELTMYESMFVTDEKHLFRNWIVIKA